MRIRAAAVMVAVGIVAATPIFAGGTARSLDIQPGGRQNGLGSTGVALQSDPSDALWWNPAALGFAETTSLAYTRAQLVPGLAADVIYQHAAFGAKLVNGVGVGVSGTFLSYGNPEYGESSSEWSGAIAAGYRVLRNLAVGVTAKHVELEFVGADASTYAFDLGGLYRTSFRDMGVSAGINLQNQGPEVEFDSFGQSSSLSRNLKMGGALTVPATVAGVEAGVVAALDHNQSQVAGDFETWHYGVEIYAGDRTRVRGALRLGYYKDDLGEIGDATFGAGLRAGGFVFDWSAIPQARQYNLDRVQKWTLALSMDGAAFQRP